MDSFTYKAKLEHWSRIVAECSRRDPGLTKNEWIRQNHISRDRFFYWQRKVREKALAEFPLSRASAPSVPSPSPAPEGCFDITSCLQQLPAESETGAEPQAASAPPASPEPFRNAAPALMIETGGCRIYVGSSVKEQTLRTVLKVLGDA